MEYFYIQQIWATLYWAIYVLSWLVIPIVQEYERAGDFTPPEKLWRSIKNNLYFYLITLVAGVFFLLYLLYESEFTG